MYCLLFIYTNFVVSSRIRANISILITYPEVLFCNIITGITSLHAGYSGHHHHYKTELSDEVPLKETT